MPQPVIASTAQLRSAHGTASINQRLQGLEWHYRRGMVWENYCLPIPVWWYIIPQNMNSLITKQPLIFMSLNAGFVYSLILITICHTLKTTIWIIIEVSLWLLVGRGRARYYPPPPLTVSAGSCSSRLVVRDWELREEALPIHFATPIKSLG